MTNKLRIGIVGYGNVGKGVATAVEIHSDMELIGIFTRRNPELLPPASYKVPFIAMEHILDYVDKIDVLVLCGGSAKDLPQQGPQLAQHFTTVDSFDTHAKIPEYFDAMDTASRKKGLVNIISVGWDPGLFSIQRLFAESILPEGKTHTFWGDGVSQGHSDAIRQIEGVELGIQYTLPIKDAMTRVRNGENPSLETHEKHERVCYIVAKDGYDQEKIREKIITMPYYFDEYHTTVHFCTKEVFLKNHQGMPHGGVVIHSGKTSDEQQQVMEFSLKLDSNPEFTGAVLVAYARAAHRLKQEGATGAKTVLDIPPSYLSSASATELRKRLL